MGTLPVAGTPPAPVAVGALSSAELDQLDAALREQKAQRLEQRRLLGSVQDLQEDPVAAAQAEALDQLMKEDDAALRRIADGTYGLCRHCGAPIPFERLELVPHASGCVRCLSVHRGR